MRAERLDAETKGRVLNAMRHIHKLQRLGLGYATIEINQPGLDSCITVKIRIQAESQEQVQKAADHLQVDFKREFEAQLGWLEYEGTTLEGMAILVYAVRQAAGCEIVTETKDVDIPPQKAIPAHTESKNSLKLVCHGTPATIIPKPTTAPEGGEPRE